MRSKHGFTLIELLVVIAIIALLLAILMPTLSIVKEQGRSVICRSNLHQWYLCMGMYENDYDGTFWPGYTGWNAFTTMWWTGMKVYHEDNNDIRCCPSANQPPDLVINNTTFPGEGPGAHREPPFRAWGQMEVPMMGIDADHGSFGCNGWLSDNPLPPESGRVRYGKYWRKMVRVSTPGKVPFMFDAQWTDNWLESDGRPQDYEDTRWDDPAGQVTQWTRVIQNRHRKGKQNAVFMDGVARTVGLKEMWTFKWHRSYDTKGIWTRAGEATIDQWPEWMRGFKDY